MTYGFSVLKPVEPAENVYILRQAPAGQTLSDIKEKQAQAAELASQQKQETATAAASTVGAKASAKTAAKADTAKASQPYVPFSPAA